MKFELEVVRFDAVDVIATSAEVEECTCDVPPGIPAIM